MPLWNIEEDNLAVENAVYAAKLGRWPTVFEIIARKPYLINCIPESRSWGILHQAVYWNNVDALSKLLDIPNCDALIKTKMCLANDAKPSSTPTEVAKQLGGRQSVIDKLELNIKNERNLRFGGKVTYVVSGKVGEKVVDQLPLFMKAVVMYRKSLLDPGSCAKTHLLSLLKQLFDAENHNWKTVSEKLHNAMYGIDRKSADILKNAGSENDFFKQIVYYYTINYYKTINNALSRDFDKIPATADDMAIALYDLLLDCILMCWPNLMSVSSNTYRGVGVTLEDVNVGSTIMFTHFLSSSLDSNVATGFATPTGTLMIIDNSAASRYRPKDVSMLSKFQGEKECLYGIGAEFKVTGINKCKTPKHVYLRLI